MASALPTIQVLLDDGTGTYATDITSRVSLSSGISLNGHGRTDEIPAAVASLTLTLKNDDGGLTTSLGFGLGPFGLGAFGGSSVPVYPGQGIRYKKTRGATTEVAFTGKISELPLEWVGGVAKSARITLTAVDPLANLSLRPLRSMLEQEILLRNPSAYYTLGEAEGSTSAGDSSGSQAAPLTIAGSGSAMTFGVGIGPGVDGLTAATFAGGQYLARSGSTLVLATAPFAMGLYFNTTTTPAGVNVVVAGSSGWSFQIDTSGFLACAGPFPGTISGPSVVDGLTHFAAVSSDGTTATLYLDGVAVGTRGVAPGRTFDLTVGGSAGSVSFTGTISHVFTVPSAISATAVAAINRAGSSTGISETTAARFARIASYAGITSISTPSNSGLLMGAQATSGVTVLDALQAVTDAEGGVLFADGSGTLVMQGHAYRALKTTPTLTVPTKDIVPSSAVVTWDTQQIVNSVTATRTGGAAQTVTNTASITTYGLYAQSLDLALAADSDVLTAAQWMVAKHASPVQRMGSATVNLLTSAISAQFLASEVGDHWSLATLPSQAWAGAGELTVEGWSETLSVTASGAEWTRTVNLLPWSLFSMFVLDNATYGVLDGLTPIGY